MGQRVGRMASAALAVGLTLLTACGGGSPHASGRGAAPDTTSASTSTTVAATTSTDAATSTTAGTQVTPRATGTTAARARAAAAASPATLPATSTTAAVLAPAYAAPAPGTYRFDTTGNTSYALGSKSYPNVSTLVVDPAAGSRQHSLRQLLNGSDGFLIESVFDYRPDGIAAVEQKLTGTFSGLTTVKDLKPNAPALILAANAGPGAHREFDLSGDSITGHEVVDVLGTEPVSVGGQSVSTLVLRTVLTFSGSASGNLQLQQWFAPSHRLPVKEQLTGQIKSGLFTIHTNYDATLQRLTPG